ncbi:hypothetical protein HYH03_018496 [Edaphochlamys debaryana]|uniref:Uncharacterized protein n=1 Tax=Edaphochlamys debaryana TaxID=47281 RepID=A0A835XHT2_9CHLO|nr:hypothetical protein HYH03_018496 [Edaphochlamys debaryana]|eukprot:KAG2482571.1 hypothetical protein HYH03_018496 [Edaphochlamys debaryana]
MQRGAGGAAPSGDREDQTLAGAAAAAAGAGSGGGGGSPAASAGSAGGPARAPAAAAATPHTPHSRRPRHQPADTLEPSEDSGAGAYSPPAVLGTGGGGAAAARTGAGAAAASTSTGSSDYYTTSAPPDSTEECDSYGTRTTAVSGGAKGRPGDGGGRSLTAAPAGPPGWSDMPDVEEPELPPDFFLDEKASLDPGLDLDLNLDLYSVYRWPDLSEGFQFTAPFIGPLGPPAFRASLGSLRLEEAFPDLAPRYHHFRVDPFRPNRVWVTLQPHCTHTGTFTGKLPFGVRPTGKVIEEPPQTCSLTFNERGQVSAFTMGYVMDRTVGNTAGLGGAFGLMWALGAPLPAPEGHPWSPSLALRAVNSGSWLMQAAAYLYDRTASLILPEAWITRHARNNM